MDRYMSVGRFDIDTTNEGSSRAGDDLLGDSVNGGEVDGEIGFCDVIIHTVSWGKTKVFNSTHVRGIAFGNKEGRIDSLKVGKWASGW